MRFVNHNQLTTNWTQQFAMDNVQSLLVSLINICNAAGSKVNVWVAVVQPGQAPVETDAILWSFGINTDDKVEFFVGGIIGPSEQVWAKCDTNGVITMRVSGDIGGG
jgi:hypothetical protein